MKNSSDLMVQLTNDFGALSRLMNMLRRRGFCIVNLIAKRQVNGGYHVDLTIQNESRDSRDVLLLVKQISNLIDVRSASVVKSSTAQEQAGDNSRLTTECTAPS